ncbi:MAG: hypothetical protein ACRDS1_03780 [Pseudonocardiaceae bacterium]
MSTSEWYSTAPRCAPCGQRAVLSRLAASRLADFSPSRLVVFACPHQPDGWHVCAPDVELTARTPAQD